MSLVVVQTGPWATYQDDGRRGWAHLGVPQAGPTDPAMARLANRLVGNPDGSTVIEILLGGFAARATRGCWICVVTSEPGRLWEPQWVPTGELLEVRGPSQGLRSWLAIAGGWLVDPVLGSRSRDTLAGVGPAPIAVGDELRGAGAGAPVALDVPSPRVRGPVRVWPGHHEAWWPDVNQLTAQTWTVGSQADRVGVRLEGAVIDRRPDELPSEAMVPGAIQVPPDGRPFVLGPDAPVTGGYPVIGYVDPVDLWQVLESRPGQTLSCQWVGSASRG